jgi:hypothetical protein
MGIIEKINSRMKWLKSKRPWYHLRYNVISNYVRPIHTQKRSKRKEEKTRWEGNVERMTFSERVLENVRIKSSWNSKQDSKINFYAHNLLNCFLLLVFPCYVGFTWVFKFSSINILLLPKGVRMWPLVTQKALFSSPSVNIFEFQDVSKKFGHTND